MAKIYHTDKEPDCCNCPCRIWAVGIGQGIFCNNPENEGRNLGYGMNGKRPLLPFSHACVCDFYEGALPFKVTVKKVEELEDRPLYRFAINLMNKIKKQTSF